MNVQNGVETRNKARSGLRNGESTTNQIEKRNGVISGKLNCLQERAEGKRGVNSTIWLIPRNGHTTGTKGGKLKNRKKMVRKLLIHTTT